MQNSKIFAFGPKYFGSKQGLCYEILMSGGCRFDLMMRKHRPSNILPLIDFWQISTIYV